MTPSDAAAWRQALADAPLNSPLRLVYADWLEEHGEGAEAAMQREWTRFGDDQHVGRRYVCEMCGDISDLDDRVETCCLACGTLRVRKFRGRDVPR